MLEQKFKRKLSKKKIYNSSMIKISFKNHLKNINFFFKLSFTKRVEKLLSIINEFNNIALSFIFMMYIFIRI